MSECRRKKEMAPNGRHWKNSVEHHRRVSEARKKMDCSTLVRKSWIKRRKTYVIEDVKTGKQWTTVNLTNWCKKHGYVSSHLCRIAKWHTGDILAGSRLYRGLDCWVRGSLINNKRRLHEPKKKRIAFKKLSSKP